MGAFKLKALIFFVLGFCLCSSAMAQRFCIFDIVGKQGPLYAAMQEYKVEAKKWGANIELASYVDERIAAEDFKAGQCDAVLLTGIRARQFNHFAGSIDSIGGATSYQALKILIETLSYNQQAQGLLRQNQYEVAGVFPLGAAYLFLRDRKINSVAKIAGRKIAVLDYDPSQIKMAQRIGAQAVASDVTNFAGKFNNGMVDIVVAPAVAYLPLELYKGVGSMGVVLRLPVAQLTFQVIINPDKFPEQFAQHSRQYFYQQFDKVLKTIYQAEEDILFFFPVPVGDEPKYQEMMREARISMTKEGFYHPVMMKLMKKIRCRLQAAQAECSDNRE
ncbi:MAG: hypothetical protein KDI39_16080 [Pseudomonadales bacterium]|nr:hypothetical protein [Pseudomonadales bacterium]